MAVIIRNKTSIYGLVGDLAALQAADAAEATARANAITAEAAARTTAVSDEATARAAAVTQEVNDRVAAIIAEASTRATAVTNEENARIAAVAAEQSARIAGDTANSDALSAHVSGAFTTAKNLLDLVNGDTTVVGSFRKAIDDVINGAPVALDTLKEIADYIAVNPDANVAAAITNHVDAAVTALKGTVTSAMDTLGEVETAVNAEIAARAASLSALQSLLEAAIAAEEASRITAVSNEEAARIAADSLELAARTASEAALDASLKAYADNAATQGGSLPMLESLFVSANKIVLSKAPKAGINGVMNFGTVRYVDNFGMAYDAPVSVDGTDQSGKTLIVAVDASGDWDGKSVQIQYIYINV